MNNFLFIEFIINQLKYHTYYIIITFKHTFEISSYSKMGNSNFASLEKKYKEDGVNYVLSKYHERQMQ